MEYKIKINFDLNSVNYTQYYVVPTDNLQDAMDSAQTEIQKKYLNQNFVILNIDDANQ